MPVCVGCGSSYSDDFKFCPHCGRARPETVRVRVEITSEPNRYEEGTLKLVYTGDKKEQVVEKGKRFLGATFNDTTLLVFYFRLELAAFHPSRNGYIAIVSSTFRGIRWRDFNLFYEYSRKPENNRPDARGLGASMARWWKDYILEVEVCWTHFNEELIKQGWSGLTSAAIERKMPPLYTAPMEFRVGKHLEDYDLPDSRAEINLPEYRYKRPVYD